jgi:hypothetical protein
LPQLKHLGTGMHFCFNNVSLKSIQKFRDLKSLICINQHTKYEDLEKNLPPFDLECLILKGYLGDSFILRVVPKFPKLRQLGVGVWYLGITDASLKAIAQSCPQLEELDIYRCTGVTSMGIQSLIDSCKRLEVIYVPRNFSPDQVKIEKNRKIDFQLLLTYLY